MWMKHQRTVRCQQQVEKWQRVNFHVWTWILVSAQQLYVINTIGTLCMYVCMHACMHVCMSSMVTKSQLVSWSLTPLFSTNMAISETKGQGWRAIPTQYKQASDILTSTLAIFLFSSHQKGKGIGRITYIITLTPATGETTITPQDKN